MPIWAIIFNPTAGGFKHHGLEAVQRALRNQGIKTRLLATEGPGYATELARQAERVERVAAYVGDGTFNEVANGLLARPGGLDRPHRPNSPRRWLQMAY